MVSPDEVVLAAEHSPIMQQITRRMIEQVLRQLNQWRSRGLTVRASVNVSVRDLYTTDLVSWLRQRLHHYGVPPSDLQLEITESALMTQPSAVIASLKSLQQLGVGASLDDFGTGFSSLQHLSRLPLTEIKIDQSFVQAMVDDPGAEAIVRAIIDLAGNLGLRVIAEGVDNEPTRQRLLADGCHIAQGWYFSKAMPGDEFDRWLATRKAPASRPSAA
jgi:EAL domain-containing protein (putative c-di-GMP-specific phosphodiesterase class I)